MFVTEYGTVNADGNGNVDTQESNTWWGFLEAKKISYANWAVSNKAEGSAALQPGEKICIVGGNFMRFKGQPPNKLEMIRV